MPHNEESEAESELLARVKDSRPEQLLSSIKETDGLTVEQYEDLERHGDHRLSKTKKQVSMLAYWLFFGIGMLFLLALILMVVGVLFLYLWDSYASGKIADAAGQIVGYVFGIASTLAVQLFVSVSRKKSSSD